MNRSPKVRPNQSRVGVAIRSLVFALAFSALLAGCGEESLGAANEGPIGRSVPDFKIPPVKPGGDVTLSSFKGSPVVLYFWATWCGPCRQFAPVLDKLTEDFEPKGAKFMAISTDDDLKTVQAFEAEHPHKSPVYWDRNHEVQALFGVESLPSIMVVDKAGKVAFMTKGIGDSTGDEIAAILAKELGG